MEEFLGFTYEVEVIDGEKWCNAKNNAGVDIKFIVNPFVDEKLFIRTWLQAYINEGKKREFKDSSILNEEYN